MEGLFFRVEETKTGEPLELPVTRQLTAILERRRAESDKQHGDLREWVFPSTLSGSGHFANLCHLYSRIGAAAGTKFWYHGLRNVFITVAERNLLLPPSLTKRLVNHAPPSDVTEGYAADWTIGQLRESAQRIADRIEALMNGRGRARRLSRLVRPPRGASRPYNPLPRRRGTRRSLPRLTHRLQRIPIEIVLIDPRL